MITQEPKVITDAADIGISLLPCPFCGGEAALRVNPYGDDSGFIVECRHGAGAVQCGCLVQACTMPMTTASAAAEVWNARPTAPVYQAVDVMTKWQKIPLGLVCLLAGGALALFFGAVIFESLTHKGGLSLLNLAGFFSGLFGIGGAFDLFGPPRAPAAPKTAIAESRFASRADIEAAGLARQGDDDGGIYLGVFKDAEGELPLRWSGETHLLTYGKPGAHKTCGYIIPNLAMRRGSTIAFDPKRQLYSITGRQRARMGKMIVVDPFGPKSDGWSPILQLNRTATISRMARAASRTR